MKTPITYYGGKQTLADIIISMFPQHKIYCELYFGGGAVFFRKNKSYLEVINDINNKLINFYDVTQNNFQQLKTLIDQTLNSESQYLHAKDVWNDRIVADSIVNAWAIWLITNGSFGGSMHGGWKWSNGSQGSHTGIYLENKREHFSKAIHNRLKNVQISCRDALKVIPERDTEDTLFYLDPPLSWELSRTLYRVFSQRFISSARDAFNNQRKVYSISVYVSYFKILHNKTGLELQVD